MRLVVIVAPVMCLASLTACADNPEVNGQLALGRDGTHPVVLLHTCRGGVEEIYVSGDRAGLSPEQTNPSLGHLRARQPVSGDVAVDLINPGPQWEIINTVTLPTEPGRGVIVTARQESAGTEMKQASARVGQIPSLQPGTVLVAGGTDEVAGRPVTTQTFRAEACQD